MHPKQLRSSSKAAPKQCRNESTGDPEGKVPDGDRLPFSHPAPFQPFVSATRDARQQVWLRWQGNGGKGIAGRRGNIPEGIPAGKTTRAISGCFRVRRHRVSHIPLPPFLCQQPSPPTRGARNRPANKLFATTPRADPGRSKASFGTLQARNKVKKRRLA